MKKGYLIGFIFIASLVLPLSFTTKNSTILTEIPELSLSSQSDPSDWTFLIYLCGDNDLDPEAEEDVNEMELGFINNAKINILVYWDRYELPANLYLISNDYNKYEFTTTALDYPTEWDSEPNMGDNATLQQFISFAEVNYPANHWAFNFWDHGAGQYGVCFDDSTINETDEESEADGLEIEEILPVFENSGISKWDLISFDCCLMNLVEWVSEFEDYCDYFVASQESIPGQGFDYVPIIQGLTNGSIHSGLELGNLMVNSYFTYYSDLSIRVGYDFPTTIALISMGELQEFNDAFGIFTSGMLDGLTPKNLIELQQLRENAISMDFPFLIDLGYFLAAIQETSSNSTWITNAGNVLAAYDQLIISFKQTHMEGTTGMSIYFPATFSASMMEYYENRYSFASNTNWFSFLKRYHTMDHMALQWSGIEINETRNHNNDGNLDGGESGDLAISFKNTGELTILQPIFTIFIQNTSIGHSNSENVINGIFVPGSTVNLSFSVDLFNIEPLTEIKCIIKVHFNLLEYTDIIYNTTIFFLSDFDGIYLTEEISLKNAYQFVNTTTFAGMMTNLVTQFNVEINLPQYYFTLGTLAHSDDCDYDLILYGEDENNNLEILNSAESQASPEILGYDAYSNETVWMVIEVYEGEGIFQLELLWGDGFEYHTEPGSWLGNPIEISASATFTESINGPGFGGLTYFVVSLNFLADFHASFNLADMDEETGGLADFYGIADDFLESIDESFPIEISYQNMGILKESVILIIMPLEGETDYTLKITIAKQLIAPIGQIIIATIAIGFIIGKLRKHPKEEEIL